MNSLGFDKAPSATRVAVAMSGGVDSSVTAAILASEGYDVIGITLQLRDHDSCVHGNGIYDARRVADKLGIQHHFLNYETRFSETIIEDFADGYMRGETPVPCVNCNRDVKFGYMLGTARDLGAEAMATGHYVRRITGANGAELHRAVDDSRDQSYFLFTTSREQLEFLRFPLGELRKTETRALAEKFGLPVADKPDSQDICFVPDGDYASLVSKLRPGAIEAGEIVDQSGRILGRHDGIIHFTVGQRRGLNIGNRVGDNNDPLYVLKVEPEYHRVIVGPHEALAKTAVRLREVNWLGDDVSDDGANVTVKLRSAQDPVAAKFMPTECGMGNITLNAPVYGVATGQAGVMYDGTRLLGGGWISG